MSIWIHLLSVTIIVYNLCITCFSKCRQTAIKNSHVTQTLSNSHKSLHRASRCQKSPLHISLINQKKPSYLPLFLRWCGLTRVPAVAGRLSAVWVEIDREAQAPGPNTSVFISDAVLSCLVTWQLPTVGVLSSLMVIAFAEGPGLWSICRRTTRG